MGLFGLFYSLFFLGAKGVKGFTDSVKDEENRQKAIALNDLTYFNSKHQLCYIKDNRLVTYQKLTSFDLKTDSAIGSRCKEGDYVLRYSTYKNGAVIKNFTLEEREKYEKEQYEIALKEGRSVYPIGGRFDDYFYIGEKIRGRRYKDFKTGDIYVVRSFNGISGIRYYMNINTGQIIRKTDKQLEKEKNYGIHEDYDKQIANLIAEINERQKEKWERGERDYLNSYL